MAKAEKKDLQIIDETPPDSTVEKTAKTELKPKIIKQTKIVYKEKPQKISSKTGISIVKSGSIAFNVEDNIASVSYTHLDVYKRQVQIRTRIWCKMYLRTHRYSQSLLDRSR